MFSLLCSLELEILSFSLSYSHLSAAHVLFFVAINFLHINLYYGVFWICNENSSCWALLTHGQVLPCSSSCSNIQQTGDAQESEMWQPGQLTPTDQRDIPCYVTWWSSVKRGGKRSREVCSRAAVAWGQAGHCLDSVSSCVLHQLFLFFLGFVAVMCWFFCELFFKCTKLSLFLPTSFPTFALLILFPHPV